MLSGAQGRPWSLVLMGRQWIRLRVSRSLLRGHSRGGVYPNAYLYQTGSGWGDTCGPFQNLICSDSAFQSISHQPQAWEAKGSQQEIGARGKDKERKQKCSTEQRLRDWSAAGCQICDSCRRWSSKTWLPLLGPCLLSADNVKRPRTRERVTQV